MCDVEFNWSGCVRRLREWNWSGGNDSADWRALLAKRNFRIRPRNMIKADIITLTLAICLFFFILAQQSWTGGTVENYVNATSQSTTPDYTFFILFSVHSASYREYVVRRIICDVTRHQACLLSGVDFSSRSYTRCLCACTSLEISNENMCSKQNIH